MSSKPLPPIRAAARAAADRLVAEIEVVAHRNASGARAGLDLLAHHRVPVRRRVHAVPEQLMQVGELLEVLLGEEVGPKHHEVMLDLLGALLLDDDGAGLEMLVVRVVVLLERLQAGERLDLGLRGVVDAAVQIAVGMGFGGVGEKSLQHAPNLPFDHGAQPWAWATEDRPAGAPVSGGRGLDAADPAPR